MQTRRPLTTAALLLAMAMAAMEATVVGTVMPTIVAKLGGVERYGWVGAAYLLASTVSVPLYGKLADLYGRKPMLLAGLALFLAGSAACALAGSMTALVAARLVQGLGAGGVQPIASTVVGDLYGIEERGRVQGLFGAVWGVAGIGGPLLGGFLVGAVSWRAVFWINVPVGVAAMAILVVALHERRGAREVRIDWAGAGLLTTSAVLLLVAAEGAWGAALGCVAALAAFVAVERRAADPVLSPSLVARRPIAVGSMATAILGATMTGTILYVPLFAQGVLGATATQAGTTIAPMLLGWPIASTITGRLLVRIGFRAPVWLGSAIIACALTATAAALGSGTSMTAIRVLMFAYGVGMGLASTSLLVSVQSSVGWEERGVVTATSMFARTMGGALGAGALGAMLARSLGEELSPEAVSALLDPAQRAHLAADPRVMLALSSAMAPLFRVIAAGGVLNLLVVAFWPRQLAPASQPPPEPIVEG
jgi:EmrB/QacA subfamily drug resistance transporter